MPEFIPGLRLSEIFYHEAVAPILARAFPRLPYAAALIGYGSEVLGFDTPRSTDHNWGPRLQLFLADHDLKAFGPTIDDTLRRELPREIHGYPTSFAPTAEAGTFLPSPTTAGPVAHKIEITTVARFIRERIGIAAYPDLAVTDWLVASEQSLLEATAGAVYHDGPGELERARAALRYYPRDVWLHLLAAQWARIAQVQPFVGRCGEVGDDLGSALVAASLVRDLMRLGFLLERRYAPYTKWFGTAFARLACADRLRPPLEGVVTARSWRDREQHLIAAYSIVATLHNDLGITAPRPTEVARFHDRPFLVIDAEGFARAIKDQIADDWVRGLPAEVGSVDQFVDSTDVLTNARLRTRLKAVYASDG